MVTFARSGVVTPPIIAIGASTGGTEAIISVVQHLPATTPGIVIVQHMPAGFTAMYAQRLHSICKMKVKEAQNGDWLEQGTILLAAGERQMTVERSAKGYWVSCQPGPRVSGHCPSVDKLFYSLQKFPPQNTIAVILTGMGADGADGIAKLKQAGAFTIGQNQSTCVVYGMPREAKRAGGITHELPLSLIGTSIMGRLNKLGYR